MNNLRILSLDPATLTGYCTPTASGTFSNKLRSKESSGMKFIKFRAQIKRIIQDDEINLVVYEKPGGRHYNGIRSHANFEGVLLQLCEELGVEYRDYSATEIKKYAKTKYFNLIEAKPHGHMTKDKMVEYANLVFSMDCEDDNHADAKWLYEMALNEFQ